jgi:hypothetical protein
MKQKSNGPDQTGYSNPAGFIHRWSRDVGYFIDGVQFGGVQRWLREILSNKLGLEYIDSTVKRVLKTSDFGKRHNEKDKRRWVGSLRYLLHIYHITHISKAKRGACWLWSYGGRNLIPVARSQGSR